MPGGRSTRASPRRSAPASFAAAALACRRPRVRTEDLTDADGDLRADVQVSERDARIAGQVLRVVMRDLDPGR